MLLCGPYSRMIRDVLEQLADSKSAHALARQIALCSCIVQTCCVRGFCRNIS